MIRHNDNPMNNNFWYLFKQLITQLTQMHKKTNIAIVEREHHFQKFQYGLIFDENNSDVIDISEDENCNKKILQNGAGQSQNKLYDRHTTHSLDQCAKNMVKKLRAILKHINNDKGKKITSNAQFNT